MRRIARADLKKILVGTLSVALVVGLSLALPDAEAASTWTTAQPGIFTGQAFDACTAPSSATMATWKKSSPYRAIGIYIGGVDRGCAQPNLTAAWVKTQVQAGWHLIPIYVGPQASCTGATTKKTLISNAAGASTGAASAQDAVNQAKSLGLTLGSTVVYDMEAYATTDATCRAGVLSFLSAWSAKLHYLGYFSGFYSSIGSGGADQVANYGAAGYVRPDYIDFARWDSVSTTTDVAIPASYWPGHRRMKQYRGGHTETYGGVTINIDTNYVDYAPLPAAKMADWDRNGWSDVLARTSGTLQEFAGNGTTVASARTLATGFGGMNAIVRIGDLNRDGYQDVVARATNGYLYFYPGKSNGTFGTRKLLSKDFKRMREIVAIGDLNRDGYPDIVAAQTSDRSLYFYPGKKGSALGTRKRILQGGWDTMSELIGVGDFNRDGYPDLVAKKTSTGALYLYAGKSGGIKSWTRLATGFGGLRDLIGVGDFNRDGYPDIAAVSRSNGALMLYPGLGTKLGTPSRLATGFTSRSPLA